MQLFKIVDEEKILINQGDTLFDSINTHSGDSQTLKLSLSKEKEEIVKNLMCELKITDNDITYVLKKNTDDENSVCYFRTRTGKNIKFKLFLEKEKSILVKPDKNGLFYLSKNWNLDEDIIFSIILECEEEFSDRFGENKEVILGINFLGELVNESKTFV